MSINWSQFFLMRSRLFKLATVLIWGAPALFAVEQPVQPAPTSVNLMDAMKWAKTRSETLVISDRELDRLQTLYRQSRSAILPDIRWVRTDFLQDKLPVDTSTSSVQGTLQRSHRPESYFQLTQPLFTGFREFSTLSRIKAESRAAQWARKQAELDLFRELGDVFYTTLTLQENLDFLNKYRQLLDDRSRELRRRVQLGQTRQSEALSTETELASLEAQIEDNLRSIGASREMFSFLTGLSTGTVLMDVDLPSLPTTLEEAKAPLIHHPLTKQALELEEASRFDLQSAQRGYFPTIDVTAKYYTQRVGFQEDIKWDALFRLDIPIFEGFLTKSQIETANSLREQRRLERQRTQRELERDVAIAFQDWQAARRQESAYQKAVGLSDRNYELQLREFRYGLINSLGLLEFLQDRQDIHQRALTARSGLKRSAVSLLAAMGVTL